MSRQPPTDPLPHLLSVARAMRERGRAETALATLDAAMGATLGHKLFTCLLHHPAARESERRYTNAPAAYPVGGRKPVPDSAWARRLFVDREPYVGYTADDIREVFFDHALIASLGCASVLNLPVVHAGRTLGVLNLLHEARWYDDNDPALGQVFAALAVPAFLRLAG
ncbi:MAG TPA: GAF domain-containing protein [Methylomirabilota bacterium]|nr:GAF domain-containing protein [Methylomirabilota bacterium]